MNFGKILIAATALLAVVARFSATAAPVAVFEKALQQRGGRWRLCRGGLVRQPSLDIHLTPNGGSSFPATVRHINSARRWSRSN